MRLPSKLLSVLSAAQKVVVAMCALAGLGLAAKLMWRAVKFGWSIV